jgi:hypothetical protein
MPVPAAPTSDVPPRALPACLAWLVFLGGLMAVALTDRLPLRPTFLTSADVHGFFLASQAFFLIFAWPFLGRLGEGRAIDRIGRAGLLPLLGLPLALVAANLSAASAGDSLRGLLLVGAVAACVTALRGGGSRQGPTYLLGALILSTGLPLVAFVGHEFGGHELGGLAAFSPLWAAVEVGRGPDLACTALCGLAAALLLWNDRPRGTSP